MTTRDQVELQLSTLSGSGAYVYRWPIPPVGASSNERIGNKIKTTGLSMKYLLYNPSGVACWVRVLVLKVKEGRQLSDTEIVQELFDGGSAQDVGPAGTLPDLIKRINRERFTVMADKIELVDVSNGGQKVATGTFWRKLNTDMIFADEIQDEAVNQRHVVVFVPLEADGDESLGSTIELTHTMSMYYKDF